MAAKLSNEMMEKLRKRRGLKADDTSEDAEIATMEPMDILREICAWELGYPSWADTFVSWAQQCGVTIPSANGK